MAQKIAGLNNAVNVYENDYGDMEVGSWKRRRRLRIDPEDARRLADLLESTEKGDEVTVEGQTIVSNGSDGQVLDLRGHRGFIADTDFTIFASQLREAADIFEEAQPAALEELQEWWDEEVGENTIVQHVSDRQQEIGAEAYVFLNNVGGVGEPITPPGEWEIVGIGNDGLLFGR